MSPTEHEVTDLTVRRAGPEDATAIADLYTAARVAAVPQMPPAMHTNAEDREWMAGRLADGHHEAWVAVVPDGRIVGYALLSPTWLDHLFVEPALRGTGIGTLLLDLVKTLRPDGFALWVFESNAGARRFYARHGLVELERTDGSANEERAPDVRMAWLGATPLAFLRASIDEVDEQLGDLLARRVALTRVVQDVKRALPRRRARRRARPGARPRAGVADRRGRRRPGARARSGAGRPDRPHDHHREPGRRPPALAGAGPGPTAVALSVAAAMIDESGGAGR